MNSILQISSRPHRCKPAADQSGAVLYVALIMLILLAMIGVVGMQVATMQERMAANYLASNLAFQRAEALARQQESEIKSGAWGADTACNFDVANWIDGIGDGEAEKYKIIDLTSGNCIPGAGVKDTFHYYKVLAFSRDRETAAASSSEAVVETVFYWHK